MEYTLFTKLASDEINFIFDFLEEANFEEDFDLISDVLYIYTSKGDYVINQHSPTQQIWISSPVSNAGYFSYSDEDKAWKDKKGMSLRQQLFQDLELLYV